MPFFYCGDKTLLRLFILFLSQCIVKVTLAVTGTLSSLERLKFVHRKPENMRCVV